MPRRSWPRMPSCRPSAHADQQRAPPASRAVTVPILNVPPWQLRRAAECVRQGGLIAYPTEAVYGLGCDPLDGVAVRRLLALKQRPEHKGLILIAADFDQLRPFVRELPEEVMARVHASWPGAATWLLPAAPGVPIWLTGRHATLAVRVTAHPLAAALCRACNSPLVSTSANVSNRPPARTALQVRLRLGDAIDFILTGAVGALAQPTPIRDAQSGHWVRV